MDKKKCFNEFARYSILSILGTLGVSCYILADTFFVSNGLGNKGLTALNLAIPVYNFIHGTGLMLGMGGATKFSISKSQRDSKRMDIIFTNTVYLAILFSVLFLLLGVFCARPLAVLLGADSDAAVLNMTITYLRWLLIFAPAFIMNDVLLCFVRNDDSPQLAMGAMLVGSFSNIVLDYIFIFPMNMGIFGAIFATGLSPIISIIMMSPHWIRKKNEFHFVHTRLESEVVKQDFSIGFPSLIGQVSSGIVMITFNALILKLEGNIGVAAYGVIANISLVVVAIYTGLAQGVQPLISSAYGTENKAYIKLLHRYSMVTMLIISGVIYLLLVVFSEQIVSVFNSENNILLQSIAEEGMVLYFTSNLFAGYNIIIATFFTSMENVVPAHVLSLLRGLVLIVPLAFLMSALWGMKGIWLTYPATELITAVIGLEIKRRYDKI